MNPEVLSEASVEDIRIRFYVDGYHGYLLAKAVAAFH